MPPRKPKTAKFHLLPGGIMPTQGSEGAAAWDLYAREPLQLRPGDIGLVKTGVIAKAPANHHFRLFLRSSMGIKRGLMLMNGVGVIDQDYCGPEDEIMVALWKPNIERRHLGQEKQMAGGMGVGITSDRYNTSTKGKKYEVQDYYVGWSKRPTVINKGERVAQLVLEPTLGIEWEEFNPHNEESRGGFGSSGE